MFGPETVGSAKHVTNAGRAMGYVRKTIKGVEGFDSKRQRVLSQDTNVAKTATTDLVILPGVEFPPFFDVGAAASFFVVRTDELKGRRPKGQQ